MTSSMATGERRWASARRGGMTVLGKVAVPKPINLPSQRLENHGMDPNVEIVPKGTLSWGSRPSSAGSNAWGTSGLSPRTDGSSSSPTHLAGRPSSGGGTRPSTAGSERGYDSNANAWGSNSRPSSASGVLTSNNSSLAPLRPRSAETRPGSSQLSRFAEPSAESSASRASTGTSERMGIATAGNDGFSLSSGDFPTLGAEKDEAGKNTEPLDCVSHGRPGSASGRVSTTANNVETADGDEISRNADFKGNSWRKDSPPYVEDGFRPGMERWRGEPHPYPNHNMARPHFESWRGAPPVNPPGGVWYRGPPGPPPYGGPPGAPGGFPMDPFPYYHPQVPPPGLTNSQPVLPGGGPHGHHSKNRDMYRPPPPMPDSYMRPGIPMRPGFYPGLVPYEGYYGPPPMGFCNPNEREMPFMGMPPGPPVYNNRPVNPNGPDPNNSRPRSREHRGPDQVEPGVTDPLGNYKVLMKHNDCWDQNDGERWSHRMNSGPPNREKGILSKSSIQENAWGGDYRKDRENTWEGDHKDRDMHYGKHAPAEVASQTREINFGSANPADTRFLHPGRDVNETDASPVVENAASPKDHSLIQKIEGLNAKARASGGRRDDFPREHLHEKVHIANYKANRPANEGSSDLLEKHYPSGVVPVSRDTNSATIEKSRESAVSSGTATSRPTRGVQSRGDNQGRGRFNGHEADGWIKKSEAQAVSSVVSGSTTNDEMKEHLAIAQPAEIPKANAEKKSDRASVISTPDHSDTQRAKMREIARQRAIQLQKEEEERIREQKAKALAKLQELDRRSGANQGPENPSQKLESDPSHNVLPQRQEMSRKQAETSLAANQRDGSSSVSSGNIGQTNERNANDNLDSAVSYLQVGAVVMKIGDKDSISLQNQLQEADSKFSDGKGDKTAPQVRESSKQKRVSHKQRQNIPSENNSIQDSTPAVRADELRGKISIGITEEASGSLVSSGAGRVLTESSPLTSDLPVHQKKKNNKSGKNKHKAEESSTAVSLSEAMPKDSRSPQASRDGEEKNISDFNINPCSIQSSIVAKDAVQSSEDHSSLPREDAHGRQNNTWKAQHSRNPRSSQSNSRVSEKPHGNDAVVWAPVRSHNKVEVSEETIQKGAENSVPSETGSNMPRNSSKTKRAEMERYVPKPVAKELAQQGSNQHSYPSSIDQEGTTDGRVKTPQGSEFSDHVAKGGFTAEHKNVDGKHKHQKAQGSWRQRLPTEATPVQCSKDSSSSTPYIDNSVQSSITDQTVKSDETLVGGSEKGPQASMDDGWNIVNDSSSTSSAAFSGMKAHAPSGRGRRHPAKGYKSSGYNQNFDRKDSNTALMDSQSPPLETSQAERVTSSKENRAVGDRSTSQWQPKSQGPQGSRPHGVQVSTGEDSRDSKRESGHNDEEFKRDKKGNSVKGHPNQGSTIEIESASSGPSDGLNEQHPSSGSGYRKNTNYGGRFNRGHESRGDWSSTPQENKQQPYSSANRERQRQSSHFEYQPVGSHNNNNTRRSNDSGAQKDNQPQPGGQRFRERGNNYSRRGRGNFYGTQSGNPSDAGY